SIFEREETVARCTGFLGDTGSGSLRAGVRLSHSLRRRTARREEVEQSVGLARAPMGNSSRDAASRKRNSFGVIEGISFSTRCISWRIAHRCASQSHRLLHFFATCGPTPKTVRKPNTSTETSAACITQESSATGNRFFAFKYR